MSALLVAVVCIGYWLARTEPALAGRCWAAVCWVLRRRDMRRYRAAAPHMRSAMATVQMVRCRHGRRCREPSNRQLCACQLAYQQEESHERTDQ